MQKTLFTLALATVGLSNAMASPKPHPAIEFFHSANDDALAKCEKMQSSELMLDCLFVSTNDIASEMAEITARYPLSDGEREALRKVVTHHTEKQAKAVMQHGHEPLQKADEQ